MGRNQTFPAPQNRIGHFEVFFDRMGAWDQFEITALLLDHALARLRDDQLVIPDEVPDEALLAKLEEAQKEIEQLTGWLRAETQRRKMAEEELARHGIRPGADEPEARPAKGDTLPTEADLAQLRVEVSGDGRNLHAGKIHLHRFRGSARNAIQILDAFQAQGWNGPAYPVSLDKNQRVYAIRYLNKRLGKYGLLFKATGDRGVTVTTATI